MQAVLKNVSVMDKGARESITNFENGVGDVAITYENEVLVAQQAGKDMELVIPSSSILIENPVALIDSHVDQHGNREAVEAFVEYLFTPEAQTDLCRQWPALGRPRGSQGNGVANIRRCRTSLRSRSSAAGRRRRRSSSAKPVCTRL